MILTRIRLDTALRKTMMALNNPNLFHGAIEQSRPGERNRILWRLDSLNSQLYLLILSQQPIDTAVLTEQFGFPDEKAQEKSYDSFLANIREDTLWNFRLTANPTVSKTDMGTDRRGKVISLARIPEQMEWLQKKGSKYGFELEKDNFKVVHSGWIRFKKSQTGKTVTIRSVTFEGLLKVTNPDLFRIALTDGIGRGKAYGLGLLTVVPYHGN